MKMSQADFAQALGVSTATVSAWEQGNRKPNGAAAKLMSLLKNEPSRVRELLGIEQ